MIIAVDAMGGDNAPGAVVEGAVAAVRESEGFSIILLGDEAAVKQELGRCGFEGDRIQIRPTT